MLQGTEFFPSLKDAVLFLEDDAVMGSLTNLKFDRNLQSLILLRDFAEVRGIVIGRFQIKSEMSIEKIKKIVGTKRELLHLPILYGIDFGHRDPCITFPIGGCVVINADEIDAEKVNASIRILQH